MPRRKTHEEFVAEIYDLVGDEYTVLSEYKNNHTKVLMKHNICGHEWWVLPCNFLSGSRCPIETQERSHKNTTKTHEEFLKEIFDLVGDEYAVLGRYVNNKTKIRFKHNTCNHEWGVMPNSFLGGSRCPICANKTKAKPRLKTHKQFVEEVYDLVGDEYTVLGIYVNSTTPILMKHSTCGHEWSVIPNNFLYNHSRCPMEIINKPYEDEEFKEKLKSVNPDVECLDTYINSTTKLRFRCLKDNQIFEMTPANILSGQKCPYCSNKKVAVGLNDMWSTHPYVASCLKDPEDGYKYVFGTHKKLNFVCPDCNNDIVGVPKNVFNKDCNVLKCNKCGDGFSYPEKFMTCLLNQLKIKYIYQLSKSDFDWCGAYRYDFYLIDYNCIIEVHGEQHYKEVKSWKLSLQEVQENDLNKYILAKQYVDNYIVIDARMSDLKYIKNSIINSELINYISVKDIDWNECAKSAMSSLFLNVCQSWNEGIRNIYTLVDLYKISETTVYRYLEKGNECYVCDFNKEEYIESIKHDWYQKVIKNRGRKVVCLETGKVYASVNCAQRLCNVRSISRAIKNNSHTKGLHWAYLDELTDDYIRTHNIDVINIINE